MPGYYDSPVLDQFQYTADLSNQIYTQRTVMGKVKIHLKEILHDRSQERVAMAFLTALQKSKRFSHYSRTPGGQWPALANFNVLSNVTSGGHRTLRVEQ